MQAVILAAGKGTRMLPLTCKKPKHLLKVANKPVIEHNLDQLKGIVEEAIVVIGYMGDKIRERLGAEYNGIRIVYAEQKEQLGTGHALLCAKDYILDRFVVMPCDDLFSGHDIKKCVQHKYCCLAKKVDEPRRFGVFELDGKRIVGVEEKPEHPKSDVANTGCWVMDKKLISIMEDTPKSVRGEYEITDALKKLINLESVVCETVEDYWFALGYPWDLLDANSFLVGKVKESSILGDVERNCFIMGNVIIGEGTKVLPGTYIEGNVIIGKNCKIGPNCYLRGNTSIGDGCHIGQAVEIKNSLIFDGAKVPHLSYVGDSVIGERSNLGAGTITANLRHDNGNVKSMTGGGLVDTNRRKLGAIIGDDVHTGVNTMVYPGRKIYAGRTTVPGEAVKEDVE